MAKPDFDFTPFEKLIKAGILPKWPLKKCMSKAKNTGNRCRNSVSGPGNHLCRFHFGTTPQNRRLAKIRYLTWILGGIPTTEEEVLALEAGEVISAFFERGFWKETSIDRQMDFLTALLQVAL